MAWYLLKILEREVTIILPTGAIFINSLDSERKFIASRKFDSKEEFENFIYNYLNENSRNNYGIVSIDYEENGEIIYTEDFKEI